MLQTGNFLNSFICTIILSVQVIPHFVFGQKGNISPKEILTAIYGNSQTRQSKHFALYKLSIKDNITDAVLKSCYDSPVEISIAEQVDLGEEKVLVITEGKNNSGPGSCNETFLDASILSLDSGRVKLESYQPHFTSTHKGTHQISIEKISPDKKAIFVNHSTLWQGLSQTLQIFEITEFGLKEILSTTKLLSADDNCGECTSKISFVTNTNTTADYYTINLIRCECMKGKGQIKKTMLVYQFDEKENRYSKKSQTIVK